MKRPGKTRIQRTSLESTVRESAGCLERASGVHNRARDEVRRRDWMAQYIVESIIASLSALISVQQIFRVNLL